MTELNQVSLTRGLFTIGSTEQATRCIFSGASQEAFGACAYIRQRGKDKKDETKLSSRVAPLKQLTISRLELQAAVLASRLAKTIQEESRIKFKDILFFSDSTIVLAWIHSTSGSFKPCVSSRVGEIQGNSNPSHWRHIPGEFNVADDVSRGIPVQDLNKKSEQDAGYWRPVNSPSLSNLSVHFSEKWHAELKLNRWQISLHFVWHLSLHHFPIQRAIISDRLKSRSGGTRPQNITEWFSRA